MGRANEWPSLPCPVTIAYPKSSRITLLRLLPGVRRRQYLISLRRTGFNVRRGWPFNAAPGVHTEDALRFINTRLLSKLSHYLNQYLNTRVQSHAFLFHSLL